MFSIEFLHVIRRHELERFARHIPPGAHVLELGAGTGYQARELVRRGRKVTAIDLPESTYRADRVFDVVEYDGETFPVGDGEVDIVLSSNVLEHIPDLARMHLEVRRVLRPGGFCLHAMPTATWRLWTSLTGYVDMGQRAATVLPGMLPRGIGRGELYRLLSVARQLRSILASHVVPPRHGEFGNAFTELWTFSRKHWIAHFRSHGYEVIHVEPMGLFYTGYMILGARWPVAGREAAARWLGSSCMLYKVRPAG